MVRVLTGIEAGVRTAFVMPDNAQLKRLQTIALEHYPRFDLGKQDGQMAQFHAAFWAVGQLGRLPQPESRNAHAFQWWIGYCEDLLRQSNHDIDIGQVFVAAVLAHGDVPHTVTDRFPYDVAFGLTIGTGIPATDRWRGLLNGTSRLLAPTPLPAHQLPPLPSQVRIFEPWRDQ